MKTDRLCHHTLMADPMIKLDMVYNTCKVICSRMRFDEYIIHIPLVVFRSENDGEVKHFKS